MLPLTPTEQKVARKEHRVDLKQVQKKKQVTKAKKKSFEHRPIRTRG
jgi:hypothetical protein